MKKYKKALTMLDIVVSFAILSCFILFLSIFLKNFMGLEADNKKLRQADNFASNAMEILRSDDSNDVYEITDKIKTNLGEDTKFNLVKEAYTGGLYIFTLYINDKEGNTYEEYQIIK